MPQQVDYDAIAASVAGDVDYDALADEVLAPVSSRKPSANKVDDALRKMGLNDAQLAELDAMDKAKRESIPQQLAAIGGWFGGPLGAGFGAYVGSRLRGESVKDSAISGVTNAVVPKVVEKGLSAAGTAIANEAIPAVRSATKASVQLLRRRAGIEGTTPNRVGNRIATTILEGGYRTSDDAAAAISALDDQITQAVRDAESQTPGLSIDSATRIPKYLDGLLRKIDKQITPGQDRAAVQAFGKELVKDSPLSQRIGPPYDRTSPTPELQLQRILELAMKDGKQRTFRAPGVSGPSSSYEPMGTNARALRTDVSPSEARSIVRAKSFFNKDASGASIAAGKETERAVRDGIKRAVPNAAPLLRRQGNAMDAEKVLEDMATRTANRDQISLPGIVGAAPDIAAGKLPIAGLLTHWLRNNQLRAGHAAYKYGPKITRSAPVSGESVRALLMALMDGRGQ